MDNDGVEVCRGDKTVVPESHAQGAGRSFVTSVFDPLGLFAAVTMQMRMLSKIFCAKISRQWYDKLEIESEEQS